MSLKEYIKPAESWTARQLADFLRGHHPEDFHLVDLRRPAEFEKGHLPGALRISPEDLPDRLAELNRGKPVILICSSGLRSRASVAILHHSGFLDLQYLAGGMEAWEGRAARGIPEAELMLFSPDFPPEKHTALAWLMEDGTGKFYAELTDRLQDREVRNLFRELKEAEEEHKKSLLAVYEGLTGRPPGPGFPADAFPEIPLEGRMEGGMQVDEALDWLRGRLVRDILELSMAMEINALDRYLFLRRKLPDENSRRVFELLSDEERHHLEKLSRLFDHFL